LGDWAAHVIEFSREDRKAHFGEMPMRRYLITMFCMTLAISTALAQEKTPMAPPPKPADEGPSLEATMKFIQEKMNGEEGAKIPGIGVGKLAVSADPATCTLQGGLGITSNPVNPKKVHLYSHSRP
jgi:hypothetical protein